MTQSVLSVSLLPQQTELWCWAASGQMIMAYAGTAVSQCQQASHRFSIPNCCPLPTPQGCVQGGWPEFPAWGFSAQTTPWGTALSFTELVAQITANRPVAFSWGWVQGGGHMMVAAGVDTATRFVYVDDPWPPNTGDARWISYQSYVEQSGVHTHWIDYYDIRPAPGGGSAAAGPVAPQEEGEMADDQAGGGQGYPNPQAAAGAGLRLLPVLDAPNEARVLNAAAVPGGGYGGLRLDEPLQVYYVGRADLAEHIPGADPQRILRDGHERLYPVLNPEGTVAAAVRVVQRDGEWEVKSVGEPRLAQDIVEVRNSNASWSDTPRRDYFIVHVPSLYKLFVGHRDAQGQLVLIPLHNDEQKGMEKAAPGAGSDLLARLVPEAQQRTSALPEDGSA
jgi:hypothetical protein